MKDTEEDVNAKLTSSEFDEDQNTISFPQRKNCGGFELLRCVLNCRVLESIECAMAVKKLKTSVGLGKIYVRPIQRSLSIISIKQEVSSNTSLKETCIYCGKKFLLKDLRSHLDSFFSFPNFEGDDALSTESTSELQPAFNNSPSVNDINDEVNENSNNESTHNEVLSENTVSAFNVIYEIVDRSEVMPQRGQVEKLDIDEKIVEVINHCLDKNLSHPIEIRKYLQSQLAQGRALDVSNVSNVDDGLTNFIMVDRAKLI